MMPALRLLCIAIGFIICWQMIVILFVPPNYILPGPDLVLQSFWSHKELIARESITTLLETLAGFVLGVTFGSLTGCIATYYKPMQKWFLPILIVSQAMPTFVLAPLFVIWLGFGLSSKIAVTTIMIFFPVASSMHDGLNKTPNDWLLLAKSMQANRFACFYRLKLPAALPTLASGIRIAAVTAPIGAIAGEWVGSSHGLGYLMLNANARMDIDFMFANVILLIVSTLTLYTLVNKLLARLIWWA